MTHLSNNPLVVAVDASEAGEGNLEIHVQSADDGASVPTQVRPLEVPSRPPGRPGQHKQEEEEETVKAVFEVDFTPRSRSDHIVRVTFNDEDVPGNNTTHDSCFSWENECTYVPN